MTNSHRQRYGLGSIIKKAAKAVKKVVKSPLGKMAIIGGLGAIPFGASGTSLWGRGIGALRGMGLKGTLGTMRGAGPLHGVAKKRSTL